MSLQLDRMEDKIECFETDNIKALERQIAEQIEINKVLLLQVHSVHHSVYIHPRTEQPIYTATVHFKAK
ncbi:DUF2536 family protein [Bacillus suaedae]|uniref:DUF2536 family protein n=1 Tax=Halalkalibacter suaedae TaxID=2822140 RepID=A0A940WRH5_9BACI|nr:DUF2536 family protein [Bacillus suaedae]MBP3951364.1 DUF2536 family protein [Bacillus suaedae]